jgi:hypothetical protein
MAAAKSRKASTKTKRPRIAPGVRAEAERRLRTGVSYREISAQLGIADGSVRAIKKALDSKEPTPPTTDAVPEIPPDAAAAVDGLALEGDLKSLVRGIINRALGVAKEAEKDGNTTAAAKALRDAVNALPGLIRLEKADAENVDAVSIPRALIDSKIEAIYGRIRTLASVEMCPHCGRELRMAAVGAAREKV